MKVDISSISMFVQNPVKDIQFAPNFGQSYHLLAIASNDIDIFTIKPAKLVIVIKKLFRKEILYIEMNIAAVLKIKPNHTTSAVLLLSMVMALQ